MTPKQIRYIILGVLAVVLVIFVALSTSGYLGEKLSQGDRDKVQNELMIDFVTLQTTIKAVNTPEIPSLQFIQSIDTLRRTVDVKKLRNPFRRKIRTISIPKKPTPKKTTGERPAPKKQIPKKKRIVRPRITINGIIWDQSNPYAILDGEIYGEGDFIKGYTIQTIVDSMIVFYNDDDVFTLNYEVE